MKAIKKISGMVLEIIIAFVIIFSIFITIMTLCTNKDGIPSIIGYSPFSIQSNSMAPTLHKGDLIIDKIIAIEDLKVNDIVSFFATEQGTNIVKTHRIIEIINDGAIILVTKGDNNDVQDETLISEVDLIGKYQFRIPIMGYIIDFLKSKWGFLFCIVIPLFIIFIYQIIGFIKLVVEDKMEEEG